MASISLKQYDGSIVRPKDDALLYDMIVNQNGYIHGCNVTWLGGNQIKIAAGFGIIKGRVFEITEQTVYAKLPSVSGQSYYGYLYIRVDLSNTSEPIAIYTDVTATEWLTENGDFDQDDDMNYINGMWEMVIAEYRATNTAITSFTTVWEKVTGVYTTIKDFSELAALNKYGYLVDALIEKKKILTFTNLQVPVSQWLENTTYTDYPYRAVISCNGVDANYAATAVFDVAEATSGTFSPVTTTVTGGVCIYANQIPDATITIPTIQCIRKVG